MTSQNKGQIRIIEAFLAVFIVFSAFTISSNLNVTQNVRKGEDLASVGLQALMELDSDGSLGKYMEEGNWTALRDALNILLPSGVCFNLTVYDEQSRQVNTEVISNGGFSSQEIAFVEYICATRGIIFRCYIIHLHLAVAT